MNTLFPLFKKRNQLGVFVIIIVPFIIFLLGITVGYNQAKHDLLEENHNINQTISTQDNSDIQDSARKIDLTLFWNVWDILVSTYVDTSKLDDQMMIYGSIKGMVSSLHDPYTIFMTPKETEDFRNSLSGDLEGIGAELSIKDHHLIVVSPLKDSPAEKAGVRPGDIIYKINDVLTTDMTLTEAVAKIRGPQGTTVTLVIMRDNLEKPLELVIERKEIRVPSVSWELKENGIIYISINQFGDDTSKEFSNAVNDILLKKPKGIILDLRYNGGGYLEGAVDIVSEFIDNGIVTTVKKRAINGKDNSEIQRVNGHARLSHLPLVVLINEGSASASEIVAGAIKDYKRGILVGQRSFGKGTVQELQPLSDGSSLRITIAQWLTPTNNNINEVGIEPDETVTISPEDEKNNKDTQLIKAIEILQKQLTDN